MTKMVHVIVEIDCKNKTFNLLEAYEVEDKAHNKLKELNKTKARDCIVDKDGNIILRDSCKSKYFELFDVKIKE